MHNLVATFSPDGMLEQSRVASDADLMAELFAAMQRVDEGKLELGIRWCPGPRRRCCAT